MLRLNSFLRLTNSPIFKSLISKFHYTTTEQGEGFSYRKYLLDDNNNKISFWKDLPLKSTCEDNNSSSQIYTVGIEIPSNILAKYEVCKTEPFHPIKQDVKKQKSDPTKVQLRYYAQYPLFNYGFLPQTWENSLVKSQEGYLGDNDPLDVVDLTNEVASIGQIKQVKVIGCFCLLDQGELDWKILVVDKNEAETLKINDFKDYDKIYPGKLEEIKKWFRYIKTYDGKAENKILFNNKTFGVEKSLEIIDEAHQHYKDLFNPEQLTSQDSKYIKDLEKLKQKYFLQ